MDLNFVFHNGDYIINFEVRRKKMVTNLFSVNLLSKCYTCTMYTITLKVYT